MDEINEFGGMTGAPISGDMLGFKEVVKFQDTLKVVMFNVIREPCHLVVRYHNPLARESGVQEKTPR